jgi:hypothetical protein
MNLSVFANAVRYTVDVGKFKFAIAVRLVNTLFCCSWNNALYLAWLGRFNATRTEIYRLDYCRLEVEPVLVGE